MNPNGNNDIGNVNCARKKFKFIMYPCVSSSVERVKNNDDSVAIYHCKYETLFRNSCFLVSQFDNVNEPPDLVFMCVPMRLQSREDVNNTNHSNSDAMDDSISYHYKMYHWPNLSPSSETIDIRINYRIKHSKQWVTYYSFNSVTWNEGATALIKDQSGNGYHGIMQNLKTYNPVLTKNAVLGKAIVFSGFNYVLCERNPLKGLPEFTISLWFKYSPEKEKDDTVILSSVKSIDKINENVLNISALFSEHERNTVKQISEDEMYFNFMFYGSKTREVLSSERRHRRSKSRLQMVRNLTKTSLCAGAEIGFKIGTIQNLFTDANGDNLIVERRSGQLRKYYDAVFGRILNKYLNDTEDMTAEQLEKLLSQPNTDDEDTLDSTEEVFQRQDFFRKDAFNHLVITYSGDRLKEYINGVVTDDKRATFNILGDGETLVVGALLDGYDFCGFRGIVDELKIFNYALSSQEIQKLFKDLERHCNLRVPD